MNDVVKFQYLRATPNYPEYEKLCVSIATEISMMESGEYLVYWTVAYKNPKDKFDKKIARETLLDNMIFDVNSGFIELGKSFTRNEIVGKILMNLYYHEQDIPNSYKSYIKHLIPYYLY